MDPKSHRYAHARESLEGGAIREILRHRLAAPFAAIYDRLAKKGELDPCQRSHGRDERVIQILAEDQKQPRLLAEAGLEEARHRRWVGTRTAAATCRLLRDSGVITLVA